MTQLTKTDNNFSHEIFGNLTTITNEENEAFFISSEVSEILGYSKNANMLEKIDSDDIFKLNYAEANSVLNGFDIHSSGIQLLTESGLYSAILGSRKEEAKDFKKWVTKEVLPAIRKTGSYALKPMSKIELLREYLKAEEKLLEQQEAIENLSTVLDDLTDWVSIIKVSTHNKVKETVFNWRTLKEKSLQLGYQIKKGESPRFGYQNLYHVNCFKALHPEFNYNFSENKLLKKGYESKMIK